MVLINSNHTVVVLKHSIYTKIDSSIRSGACHVLPPSLNAGETFNRESSMMMLAQRRVPVLIAQYRGDVVLEFQMTDTRCVESACGQLHHGIMILIIHAQAIWGVNRCLSSSMSSSSSSSQPNHQWLGSRPTITHGNAQDNHTEFMVTVKA